MSKLIGKKLLEAFVDRPAGFTASTPSVKPLRLPVVVPENPRKDIPVPESMKHLPVDDRNYKVPYFVAWLDGKPDFRCIKPEAIMNCIRENLCWVCGGRLDHDPRRGYMQTFTIGPMCMINHISAEPGSHYPCARYAIRVCPFLTAPHMRRNEKDLPPDTKDPGGFFIKRNPGAYALWTTASYNLVRAGHSALFRVGPPIDVEFWREGRYATRAEVMESIRTGLPLLEEEARQGGQEHMRMLSKMTAEAIVTLDRFV